MKTILIIVLAFYCSGLYAANTIDIFDQNRGQKKSAPIKKITPQRKRTASRGNAFSLSGISKMGDKYVFYFDTKKGKRDKFSWSENQAASATKIYNNYEINKVIDRTLYLKLINNQSCVEDPGQGISCDKKNKQMVMQLKRKKAIAKPVPRRRKTPRQAAKKPLKSPFKRSKTVKSR